MPSFENSVKTQMLQGAAGRRANTENWNTISHIAESEISFGQPVERGADESCIRPFAGGKFLGIAEADISMQTPAYPKGATVPVLTAGVIFVPTGGTCTIGAQAKFDPATGLYSDAGTTTIPDAEFDSGALNGVAKLRLTRLAGKA